MDYFLESPDWNQLTEVIEIENFYLPDLPAMEADVDAPSHACEFSISFA